MIGIVITAWITLTGLICAAYFALLWVGKKCGLVRPNLIAFVLTFGSTFGLNIASHVDFAGSETAATGGAGAAGAAGILAMYVSITSACLAVMSWHFLGASRTREVTR